MHFPIYFRKDTGKWYIDLRGAGGGQRSLRTGVKREAIQMQREIELNHQEFRREKNRVTIEQFAKDYLAYSQSTKAPNTYSKEFQTLQHFRRLFPEVRYVHQVTPRVADLFLEKMANLEFEYRRYPDGVKYVSGRTLSPTVPFRKKLSPASVNSYLASVRSIFGTAVRWQYMMENPFKGNPGIPEDDLPARILSREELRAVFDASERLTPVLTELWEFYLLTGARRSEALNLEWPEVDFDRGFITLVRTKGKSKRKKKFRKIVMRPRVRQILQDRKLFPQPFQFKPHRVTTNFKRVVKAAGITDPQVSLHSLRATFVSYIQDAGMPIGFVSWIVGHASEAITQQEYTGFSGEMLAGYFTKFEAQLLPAIASGDRNKTVTTVAVETPSTAPKRVRKLAKR